MCVGICVRQSTGSYALIVSSIELRMAERTADVNSDVNFAISVSAMSGGGWDPSITHMTYEIIQESGRDEFNSL